MIIHGHKSRDFESPTHASWRAMKARCSNRKDGAWDRYGGRGIKVCERWMNFENFLLDMGIKPDNKTLDRINNDGDYEPGNCRWATIREQNLNRRSQLAANTSSGVVGVYFHTSKNKWIVQIRRDSYKHYESFSSKEAAVLARKAIEARCSRCRKAESKCKDSVVKT